MDGFPCRESNRMKERPRIDRHIELKYLLLRATKSGRVYFQRVPGERNLAAHLTKGNTFCKIDELSCVVGALMKVKGSNMARGAGPSRRQLRTRRDVVSVERRGIGALSHYWRRGQVRKGRAADAPRSTDGTEKQMGQQKQSSSAVRQRQHCNSGTGRQSAWWRKRHSGSGNMWQSASRRKQWCRWTG